MVDLGQSATDHSGTQAGGCLRALLAAPVLAVLAPVTAIFRTWARWRRGSTVVVKTGNEDFERFESGWAKVTAEVNIPDTIDGVRLLTRSVVRIAEALHTAGQVFHLVYREPGNEETITVPLGLTINDMAERFALSCRRSILDGSTLLWLCLPRGRHLGEFLDPIAYDPDAPGEPEALLQTAPITWALALGRHRGGVSTVFKMEFIVPRGSADQVMTVLARTSLQ